MNALPSPSESWTLRVEKIGGDDAFTMRQTLTMLEKRANDREAWVYVFSAFKDSTSETSKQWNTTDYLIDIARWVVRWDSHIETKVDELFWNYRATIEHGLDENSNKWEVLTHLEGVFTELRNAIRYAISEGQKPSEKNDYSITYNSRTFSLMGWGEMLVSKLYSLALGKPEAWVDTYAEVPDTSSDKLRKQIAERVMSITQTEKTVFVPGYSGNLEWGIYEKVGRGYSDWTAWNLYAWIRRYHRDRDVAFMIRKLYGLSSSDPRIVENVQLLTHMSYELLLQMIDPDGADAWFVNRAAAMPEIFRNGGQMKVYTDWWHETRITMNGPDNPPEGIQFVQNRRVRKIRIHSYNMNKNGYFAFVAGFLSQRWYSIIDDSSDATSINLMLGIKKKKNDQTQEQYRWAEDREYTDLCRELRSSLKQWEKDEDSEVSVDHESKSLIFTGGENIDRPGILAEITRILALAQINLWPVVQTDKPKVIVFWVEESKGAEAVKILHKELIENGK